MGNDPIFVEYERGVSIVSGKSFDHECSLYAEQTIAQTIENALAQNFDGHEIVVVNEGSTDSTAGS